VAEQRHRQAARGLLRGHAEVVEPPLTSTIEVGRSLLTYQVFDLPKDARGITLTLEHPVGFSPGLLVIGDEGAS
jgi:hypothetical protein